MSKKSPFPFCAGIIIFFFLFTAIIYLNQSITPYLNKPLDEEDFLARIQEDGFFLDEEEEGEEEGEEEDGEGGGEEGVEEGSLFDVNIHQGSLPAQDNNEIDRNILGLEISSPLNFPLSRGQTLNMEALPDREEWQNIIVLDLTPYPMSLGQGEGVISNLSIMSIHQKTGIPRVLYLPPNTVLSTGRTLEDIYVSQGMAGIKKAIEGLIGLEITNYMRLDFEGIEEVFTIIEEMDLVTGGERPNPLQVFNELNGKVDIWQVAPVLLNKGIKTDLSLYQLLRIALQSNRTFEKAGLLMLPGSVQEKGSKTLYNPEIDLLFEYLEEKGFYAPQGLH